MKYLLPSLAFLSLVACQPAAKDEDEESVPKAKSAKAAPTPATPPPAGSWMWEKKKADKLAPDGKKPLSLDDKAYKN